MISLFILSFYLQATSPPLLASDYLRSTFSAVDDRGSGKSSGKRLFPWTKFQVFSWFLEIKCFIKCFCCASSRLSNCNYYSSVLRSWKGILLNNNWKGDTFSTTFFDFLRRRSSNKRYFLFLIDCEKRNVMLSIDTFCKCVSFLYLKSLTDERSYNVHSSSKLQASRILEDFSWISRCFFVYFNGKHRNISCSIKS